MHYTLFAPSGLATGKKSPSLIWLNGGGRSDGNEIADEDAVHLSIAASRLDAPAFVLIPSAIGGQNWTRAPGVGSDSGQVSFFFSSRRRHTRSLRDWSSDVCSSDLIRGVVGKSLTVEGVRLIGQALGSELLDRTRGRGRPEIAVGRDGRLSGPQLAEALMDGIRASGVDVADIGMFATPIAYFAAHELGCGSAVAVTGSHNPPEYNGLKMVLAGTTLAGEDVQRLRKRIEAGELAKGAGRHRHAEIREAYLSRITSDVRLARRMKI